MTFFSLLYDVPTGEQKNDDWMKWVKATEKNKKRNFEYIGTHMVEVKKETVAIKYPAFFEDLNLNQIIKEIYDAELEPQLNEMYTTLISDEKTIYYRHEIMRDLEKAEVYEAFVQFQNTLKEVKRKIVESEQRQYGGEFIYLEAIDCYCGCIRELEKIFETPIITSQGLKSFGETLLRYSQGKQFKKLSEKITLLKQAIENIHYQLVINENKVIVRLIKDEEKFKALDYSERLKGALGILQDETLNGQGKIKLFVGESLNPLEIKIIEVLKSHYQELFKSYQEFVAENKNFIADFIEKAHGEIPFYMNFILYMQKFKDKKVSFTYPEFTDFIDVEGIYDLSLAQRKEVVVNDFEIKKGEKGACITGANQGGKTTFLRSVGQLIYFSALGLPVAASKAKLPLYERVYTHFSQAEDAHTDDGKLKEELIRVKEIHDAAKGVVLMNELFSSTTASDAFEMSKRVVKKLEGLGYTIFLVTHVTALAKETLDLVSMVAVVNTNEEGKRTYKIIRQEADGLAYTQGLVKKYGLLHEIIRGRIKDEN